MNLRTQARFVFAVVGALMLVPGAACSAEGILRRQNDNFPIASSVLVPAGSDLVFLSGTLADAIKPDAPVGSTERLGDTETQAASILAKLAKELAASNLGLADVVKMNVYLVGDPGRAGAM